MRTAFAPSWLLSICRTLALLFRMANSMKSLIKTGFGLGLGLLLAQIVFLLIGLALFVPGYTLYTEKVSKNASDSEKVLPVLLMACGVVIMGGAGLGLLLDSAGDLFN